MNANQIIKALRKKGVPVIYKVLNPLTGPKSGQRGKRRGVGITRKVVDNETKAKIIRKMSQRSRRINRRKASKGKGKMRC